MKKASCSILAILACVLPLQHLHSHDFGIHGQVFVIEEADLIAVLRERLEGLDPAILKKWRDQIINKTKRPTPVIGLQRATRYRLFCWDPTRTLQTDIFDHQGRVLFPKGTQVNPLEMIALPQELLFFDGEDPEQLQWAKDQSHDATWILVRGSPMELEDREVRPVYFDQFGYLTEQMGIKAIPARVSQAGHKLKVEEFALEETHA